jgi:hypothetical protein
MITTTTTNTAISFKNHKLEHENKENFIRVTYVISGLRRGVGENCALLSYYAASSGNSLSTFRDNQSRNVGKELRDRAEAHSSLTLEELHNVFLN